jgi:hypothetical protein
LLRIESKKAGHSLMTGLFFLFFRPGHSMGALEDFAGELCKVVSRPGRGGGM